ncbi:Nonsense-mediated mRNA decay protein 5 [Glugoides intestinalis]
MDQRVKQLFLQTTSPNDILRNNAESQLKSLEKNVDFINYIRNVLMVDKDRILQQISSIYFMNAMEKYWKAQELASVIADIEKSILQLLTTEEKYPRLAYQKILHCIFDNSEKDVVIDIFNNSSAFLNSTDLHQNKAALMLFEEVFKSESLRFNLEDIVDIMFNKLGAVFTSKFTEYIASRKYSYAGTCMKIIAKAYSSYSIPEFLNRTDVFYGFFQLAGQLILLSETPEENDGFMKMQKWTAFFLYKCASKGLKRYFKNSKFVEFIKEEQTLRVLYDSFNKLLSDHINKKQLHPRIPTICADFFILFSSNKRTKALIKSNYMALISSFILPAQKYCDDIEDCFEDNAENYLQTRYNYYNSDLRSSTSELFKEILQSDKEIEENVISSLKKFLDEPVDKENAKTRYGVIGLLADTQKTIAKRLSKDGFHLFLIQYIFSDIASQYPFLVSQALYFLSLTESIETVDASLYAVLNRIVAFTNGENEIIAVEACLALNAFFFNEALQSIFKPIIPSLFEKILFFTKKYFLESLSTLCDSIIDCFTECITAYAPLFVQTICSSFMDHIDNEKDDALPAISGCLTTIEKLVMTADDKPDIVNNIYIHASNIIYYVFKNQKTDFFQECFDLMNSFLFVLQNINESMFEIFTLALSSSKEEICLYPREVSDFIDNYLSYGKDRMITQTTLEQIYNCIDIFMPLNSTDCDVYDEDFEAAYRIIDSLMLNAGSAAHRMNQNLIPAILHKIVSNYDFASTYDDLPVYALDSIMNCFIVVPEITVITLGSFISTFFTQLDALKNKFIRVYDKKLLILFLCTLFKMSPTFSINYEIVCNVFVLVMKTLPDAIKERNRLKQKEDDGKEDDYSSDYTAGDIFEDIYFETVLDKLDVYEFVRNALSAITVDTIGANTIAAMDPASISAIKLVLEIPQEAQK